MSVNPSTSSVALPDAVFVFVTGIESVAGSEMPLCAADENDALRAVGITVGFSIAFAERPTALLGVCLLGVCLAYGVRLG
jgi:hypothetical protein